jgi:purine catabolism regulator
MTRIDAQSNAPATSSLNGVTVRDLVGLRYLQATVLAGEAGLDQRVTWAHVSDAFDPWNWLDPGDLVLTCGYILPEEPQDQVTFVERLATAGLSGLVVGEDERCPPISGEMLATADHIGFPVIFGAHTVGFAQYVRFVAAANARAENQSFTKIARVHGEVMASLREDLAGTEFVDRLSHVVDCRLLVVDPEMWEPLVRGGRRDGRHS